MLSKVVMCRTIKQYKTVIVQHDENDSVRSIYRMARMYCANGEGFVRKEKDRVSILGESINPVTHEDLNVS